MYGDGEELYEERKITSPYRETLELHESDSSAYNVG
jgi:hypothetical protein